MTESEKTPAAEGARKEPKVIKRYTNRKLYDTVESRYVTLEEISQMIMAGSEVKIVDNRSKEDLTSVTLAQIIFEQEKKKSRMPLAMLREMIRHGGETLTGFLTHQVGPRVASIKEEADALRDRLLRREGEDKVAAEAAATVPRPTTIDQAKELVAQSQRVFEDWQKRIDEGVRHAVENVTSIPGLAKDLAALEKKIAEVEKKLEELERPEAN